MGCRVHRQGLIRSPAVADIDEATGASGEELLWQRFSLEPAGLKEHRRHHRGGRIEDRQERKAVGMIDGGLESDDATPAMTYQGGALDVARVTELSDVSAEQSSADSSPRLVGAAVAPGVDGVDGMTGCGEYGDLVPPRASGSNVSVHQDNRQPRTIPTGYQRMHAKPRRGDEDGLHRGQPLLRTINQVRRTNRRLGLLG